MSIPGRRIELVGDSAPMDRVREQLASLAQVPWPVRIEGPTGSGKSLAARLLHRLSARVDGPFVACNVNMIARGLELGELRGHVRGAYTGAVADRAGVFEAAHGGTLFVDEIATATPIVQMALLQLVEEHTVRRVGESRDRYVDVRFVFATNVNLEEAVLAGEFRRDLFHRLGLLIVQMPALEKHREDIPQLSQMILEKKSRQIGAEPPVLSADEMQILLNYDWPGNVRELEHVLEHYVALGCLPGSTADSSNLRSDWREYVEQVLREHDGNKTAASRALGVSRNTLYKELSRRSG